MGTHVRLQQWPKERADGLGLGARRTDRTGSRMPPRACAFSASLISLRLGSTLPRNRTETETGGLARGAGASRGDSGLDPRAVH